MTSSASRDLAHYEGKNMADVEATKALSGLLNGIAQRVYHNKAEITEELLKNELYPELSPDEFRALHERMRGLLKVTGSEGGQNTDGQEALAAATLVEL